MAQDSGNVCRADTGNEETGAMHSCKGTNGTAHGYAMLERFFTFSTTEPSFRASNCCNMIHTM